MGKEHEKKKDKQNPLLSQNSSNEMEGLEFEDNRDIFQQLSFLQQDISQSSMQQEKMEMQQDLNQGFLQPPLFASQEEDNPFQSQVGIKRSHFEAYGETESEFEPPKKKPKIEEKKQGIHRLIRSNRRNLNRKAKPKKSRFIHSRQKQHNYGYDHKIIDYGNVKGDFYKGPFVNQPYLRIDKDDYGLDAKPKSNYDDIIKVLESFGDDSALAKVMLANIKNGTNIPDQIGETNLTSLQKANISLLIQLTQFIEPHDTRVPGVDKLARSFFKQIAAGTLTFKAVFNRKDGHYVVARAKKTKTNKNLSNFSGQDSGRAMVNAPRKKSDKATYEKIWSPELELAADEMSESSDEEFSEDEFDLDKE